MEVARGTHRNPGVVAVVEVEGAGVAEEVEAEVEVEEGL